MFRKKQEKVVPNFTPLYIRLSSLYHSINNNKCEIYGSKKITSFICTDYNNGNKRFDITFTSKHGLIDFTILSSGVEEYKDYQVIYTNKETRWMFEILCRTDITLVQPSLGKNIHAKDIDLALFELEDFIEKLVIETKVNFETHVNEVRQLESLSFENV